MNCKLPETNEDLKDAIHYNWDAIYGENNEPVNVICLAGFPHSIGGRFGINELYCYSRNKELNIDNIMLFSGDACLWDIEFKSSNYYKNKWNEERIEHTHLCKIYRNRKLFYALNSYDLDYLMARAKVLMTEIHEHSICFDMIDYEKEIIGRKILWKQTPCIIISYTINNNLIIVPDFEEISPESFLDITKFDREYYDSNDYSFPEDLFSKSIDWFR